MALADDMRLFRASLPSDHTLTAVVLLDGLSMREEVVLASLSQAIPDVPLVGGSAGDGLNFKSTKVLTNGKLAENQGAIALIASATPTTTFMGHHFRPSGKRLVVTAADPARRRVIELDGMPAADAYRRALELGDMPLSREVMAVSPLMLSIGGRTYVRSLIDEVDGALELYCSIEEGLVLQIGQPSSLEECLDAIMHEIRQKVGPPMLILGFDCILRRLEIETFLEAPRIPQILADNNFFGFSTYGEAFGGLHVNQTLTGLAFGG